ncbi:hypothetical protein CEXT_52601 [Caerostris extrusa]|uniref:DDE-1 domain-containing protein n=1 Tax=Caerostris extrusa TaxID=172846 RepID=A0AAV4NDY9_CAEEX|nr:hypothetical protein CEXT_52601 [Caerostris extrusa]
MVGMPLRKRCHKPDGRGIYGSSTGQGALLFWMELKSPWKKEIPASNAINQLLYRSANPAARSLAACSNCGGSAISRVTVAFMDRTPLLLWMELESRWKAGIFTAFFYLDSCTTHNSAVVSLQLQKIKVDTELDVFWT